jgi:hypothetical protein
MISAGGTQKTDRGKPDAGMGKLELLRMHASQLEKIAKGFEVLPPPYDGDLSAESWKMHYIGLGHSLERIPRFAPGCQAAYDDKCLKSPFP